MLTQGRLKELFDYNPKTGEFKRKEKGGKSKIGCILNNGYLQMRVHYAKYLAHRLAWLYYYGEFPLSQIDHINHNRSDNRIKNLRAVSHKENSKNKEFKTKNRLGCLGVRKQKGRTRYRSTITVNNNIINLGSFKELSNAIKARKEAEVKYNFHPNHGKEVKCQIQR